VVVRLGAGDDHALRIDAVQVGRLAPLHLVPHEDAIRRLVNQPLGRQVIPAADAEHRGDAERARRPHVLDLREPKYRSGVNNRTSGFSSRRNRSTVRPGGMARSHQRTTAATTDSTARGSRAIFAASGGAWAAPRARRLGEWSYRGSRYRQ
jgi:hypothetical protein